MEKTTPATTDINAGSAALKRLVVVRRLSQWFWNVTHNGLAMAGIALLSIVLVLASQSSVRVPVEEQVLQWLQGRQEDRLMLGQEVSTEPRAADRVNVTASSELPDYQAALSRWISRTYRVASPPINVLIAEAYAIGERTHIDPALLLSIAAVDRRALPAYLLRLAREEGLLVGGSCGMAVVAALRVAARLGPGATVATLIVDSGLRYLSTDVFRPA